MGNILGAGALAILVVAQLLRTLFCLVFVLVTSRMQGQRTGRYPTLAQATEALLRLLIVSRSVGRGRGDDDD